MTAAAFKPIESSNRPCEAQVPSSYYYPKAHQCTQRARWVAPDGKAVCGTHKRALERHEGSHA